MKSDIEIAQEAKMKPIADIAVAEFCVHDMGIDEDPVSAVFSSSTSVKL